MASRRRRRTCPRIACLSNFLTRDDLAAGTLVLVLAPLALAWSQPAWAVFYKQRALAPQVAALVDFPAKRLGESILDT